MRNRRSNTATNKQCLNNAESLVHLRRRPQHLFRCTCVNVCAKQHDCLINNIKLFGNRFSYKPAEFPWYFTSLAHYKVSFLNVLSADRGARPFSHPSIKCRSFVIRLFSVTNHDEEGDIKKDVISLSGWSLEEWEVPDPRGRWRAGFLSSAEF